MADIILRRETPGTPGPSYIYVDGNCYERGDSTTNCGDIYEYINISNCNACNEPTVYSATTPAEQHTLFFRFHLNAGKGALFQGNSFWAVSKRARRNSAPSFATQTNITGASDDQQMWDAYQFTPYITDIWGTTYGNNAYASDGGYTGGPDTTPTEENQFCMGGATIQITTNMVTLQEGDEWALGHQMNPWHLYQGFADMADWCKKGWFWKPAGTTCAGAHDLNLPKGMSDAATWSNQMLFMCKDDESRWHHIYEGRTAPNNTASAAGKGGFVFAAYNTGAGWEWVYDSTVHSNAGNNVGVVHFNTNKGTFNMSTEGVGGAGCQGAPGSTPVHHIPELDLGFRNYPDTLNSRVGLANLTPIEPGGWSNRGSAIGLTCSPVQDVV